MATILSQNTSDVNSGRAYRSLISTFGNWEKVADASIDDIEAAIAGGGLSRVKAPRIKAVLNRIRDERGSLDLGFLADVPLPQAREWLQSLPGVGPKTAACVLLFSLGRPAFPVDTHVYRVSKRLGLIENGVSPAKAHQLLERLVPGGSVYRFHMNLVKHGRHVCRAQRPRCHECVLREMCVYAKGKV
jgi:endonuclease-3